MSLDSVSRDAAAYLWTRCLEVRARISRHFLWESHRFVYARIGTQISFAVIAKLVGASVSAS